jgi:hypothetical protein
MRSTKPVGQGVNTIDQVDADKNPRTVNLKGVLQLQDLGLPPPAMVREVKTTTNRYGKSVNFESEFPTARNNKKLRNQ